MIVDNEFKEFIKEIKHQEHQNTPVNVNPEHTMNHWLDQLGIDKEGSDYKVNIDLKQGYNRQQIRKLRDNMVAYWGSFVRDNQHLYNQFETIERKKGFKLFPPIKQKLFDSIESNDKHVQSKARDKAIEHFVDTVMDNNNYLDQMINRGAINLEFKSEKFLSDGEITDDQLIFYAAHFSDREPYNHLDPFAEDYVPKLREAVAKHSYAAHLGLNTQNREVYKNLGVARNEKGQAVGGMRDGTQMKVNPVIGMKILNKLTHQSIDSFDQKGEPQVQLARKPKQSKLT